MASLKELHTHQAVQKNTISELKVAIESKLRQLFEETGAKTISADIFVDKLEPKGYQLRLNISLQLTPLDKKELPTQQ